MIQESEQTALQNAIRDAVDGIDDAQGLLDQSYPIGSADGETKTLRNWTGDDFQTSVRMAYRRSAEAVTAAREHEEWVQEAVQSMRFRGVDRFGGNRRGPGGQQDGAQCADHGGNADENQRRTNKMDNDNRTALENAIRAEVERIDEAQGRSVNTVLARTIRGEAADMDTVCTIGDDRRKSWRHMTADDLSEMYDLRAESMNREDEALEQFQADYLAFLPVLREFGTVQEAVTAGAVPIK
ncbi:hypothetical protein QK292_08725 [Arthrobacter sp. AL08]|uniref:hypothetical protein n=1 Tax=unclassified Arthrobacter TaxID=235627 RepID=UPI00249A9567|nr:MULTISPECIES: hypothetical protein [unclassified Arthrobacter]MDI3241644.1 hypothetical protein [Arthrobacter sp. AL05]MDI3277654.1 hypothetical protein [Arthrobacter sp. AL08]